MSDSESSDTRLWGGRFSEPTDEFVQRFTASVSFDVALVDQDIRGSLAHAAMLNEVGVLTDDEHAEIERGLEAIREEIDNGEFAWSVALEDVHMNIESRLIEMIGDAGKKLHTGRSRNDQIATDIRLWLRDRLDDIDAQIHRTQNALLDLADQHTETVMPGFTHLQTAQPVTFAHHMMAWFEMVKRDRERFVDCRRRTNVSPLGSAALAGTTFPIDRRTTAEALGFSAPCANSLDGVSDRDFAIEFTAAASIAMVHLSRWCEEMVLWTSQAFDFVTLPDAFCTGSSIMPQKKNPDVPELVRGKAGRVIGDLNTLLVLMKGQPLTYNKDNQEDKEPLFDATSTLLDSLRAIGDIIENMAPNADKMRDAAEKGYATATDLADYLVVRGVPFRDAHEVVGRAVALAIEQDKSLNQIDLATFKTLSKDIDEDVYEVLSLEGSIAARDHEGGTAPATVRTAIRTARAELA